MNQESMTTGLLIRRVLALSLIGFLVVTFSGPLAVLIGFAFVGWVVYSLYLMIFKQQPPASLAPFFHWTRRVTVRAFRVIRWPVVKLWQGARGITGLTLGTLQSVYTVGCEAVSGGVLGAALGVVVGVPTQWDHVSVAAGGVAGALLGLYLGLQHLRTQRRLQAKQKQLVASLS